ncbi:helix-turn-helix transcriptional regulator [Chitinophaga flava]|uniref:HTH araC/xylS-type domain-containing protein n=1 Tax=Chitinophaga flava TaxID=2259036 RepID=A0A365XWV5_9BACT|nr:AraC family transcriptional regulator [Chitinophaga flava]RBL90842.1 hypothetical protein DF182_30900 [Chitinophaga flava]
MPYTISGDAYKEIAARRFSAGRSFGRFENGAFDIPFVRHQVQHQFNQDFDIIQFRADFLRDITVHHVQDVPHISLHFQLKGSSCADFQGLSGSQPLTAGQYNLYGSTDFHSNLHFKAQQDFEYLAITFRSSFLQAILEELQHPPRDIAAHLTSGATFTVSEKALPLTPEIQQALRSLLHSPMADNLLPAYRRNKVAEIILLTFASLDTNRSVKMAYQQEMKAVYHFILEHFMDIQSLADVARHSTLTEHQIKQQLRLQYGTSLYELIQERKMSHALHLLQETDMHVNEIAWLMGYANASNFIHAFKRQYQQTPGQIKR